MKTFTITLLSLIILSSCATIFKGNSRHVNLRSAEAYKVYIDDKFVGKTPLKLNLENHKGYLVVFKKNGKVVTTGKITKRISAGWVILDVITGLIPVVVDAVTGSWYYLEYVDVYKESGENEIKM